MTRKLLRGTVEVTVLTRSRRRCCVCWGLNRDVSIKSGQIAHLDGDPENGDIDNLAFLCFEHHDQYDSQTSQSKGLTLSEVRHYRDELYEVIGQAWKQPVKLGDVEVRAPGDVSGHYVRETRNESAEIEVSMLPGNRVRVSGISFWGTNREFGPHIGELEFDAPINERRVVYLDENNAGETYRLELVFERGRLFADEGDTRGPFGLNVSFGGEYHRVGPEV